MTQTQHNKSDQKQKQFDPCTKNSTEQPNLHLDNACMNNKKQLKSEQQLNEMILKNAPVIILILNKQGCIEMFNPFMENLSGYQLSEVKGKDWFRTFLPESIQEKMRGVFFKAINNIHTQGNINPIVTKAGKQLDIAWYDNTLRNSDGNITGLLCIGHDISNFYDAKKAAESNRQMKSDYLDKMGHEIRTPMNAILGFSEILSELITDHKQKEYLNTIKLSVQALLSVLDHGDKTDVMQSDPKKNQIDLDNIVFKRDTTILVVDDISTNRYVLTHYLKALGFQILQANNGKTAIAKAKAHQPDLIFMDYYMPIIDGYKAAKIINNEKGLRKIPIVIVTASVSQEILDKLDREGFSYIKKPFHKNTITNKLMQLIPYTLKNENSKNTVNTLKNKGNTTFDIKRTLNKLESFPEFKKDLEINFYPKWKTFHEKLYMDRIKQWTLELNEKALFFSCEPLQDYSNRILEHIDSFDLVSLQNELKFFSKIIGKS